MKVYLIKRSVKLKDGKKADYWQKRWRGTNGKWQTESIGRANGANRLTKSQAQKLVDSHLKDIHTGDRPMDRPQRMSLKAFADLYEKRRKQEEAGRGFLKTAPRLRDSTIRLHSMTLRYLREHFGDDRSLDSITVDDADQFVNALAANELKAARHKVKRNAPLSEQTVRKHIRNVKAVFNWAKLMRFVSANPFDDFDGVPLQSKANPYVSFDDIEKVLDACPSDGWRCLFALCRLAGLRLSEAIELPWMGYRADRDGVEHEVGIDWGDDDRVARINLVAKKTSRFRSVPICSRLLSILAETFDTAKNGAGTVCGLSENNLTRNGKEIVESAGLTTWRKLYQSLRSSCENDWKTKGVAEPTYCAWIGHGAKVSRGHYVTPTESEFAAVAA